MPFGQLVLFSTEIGGACLLGVPGKLEARLARDGDPWPIHLEGSDASFAIQWKGKCPMEGPVFVYADRDPGRVTIILSHPTQELAPAG